MNFRFISAISLTFLAANAPGKPLFDGRTFEGWEGETSKVWRITDGVIVGGSLDGNPQNEFLSTTGRYQNFHLSLEYKLVGTEGFVNGGVQFRSERTADPANEMSGYQADIGAGYSGFLYDESRRKRFLAEADVPLVEQLEKPGDWNRYEVVADGPSIEIFLNGQRTLSWLEDDPSVADSGMIALQIHGNCKAEIAFRDISITELPSPVVPPQGEIIARLGKQQPRLPYPPFEGGKFALGDGETIALVGQENFVREQKNGALESILVSKFVSKNPRFRPMAWEADTVYQQWRDLNFGPWARQLEAGGVSIIVAQFGQMEALDGVQRLTEFTTAYHRLLDQFSPQTHRFVLVSPMPFEKPTAPHAPDLTRRNADVEAYCGAIREIARQRGAVFVDLFTPLVSKPETQRFTEDGIHLTRFGLRKVAEVIATGLGAGAYNSQSGPLREAIVQKNQLWFDCWRPANWSFAYGDRVNQMYGKGAGEQPPLKDAFERQLPLVRAADERVLAIGRGESPAPLDLPKVAQAQNTALSPGEQMETFTLASGYAVNLFASESLGVVNPTQFAWDEHGRLYVACSPSYPQSLASQVPSDYILVCKDTTGDGRADTSWRFAEGLTMVQGVEPGAGGVYVCDFDRVLHLSDTDGDGKADKQRILYSGFGVGDTHQLANSICHGPDGSLWFSQGLHAMSRVETPWGIVRLDRSALWRMRPRTLRLEGFFGGGMAGANCWGIAFDDYGQVFHKSGDRPQGYWSVPGLVRGGSPGGSGSETEANASYQNSPEQYHPVGPLFDTSPKTTSLDIIGTRALPDEIQGCALIGGYFGSVVELHRFEDAGSGFTTTQLPKLMTSSDNAFRPVDVSVGPDGAIYLADWYNPIIGHYQASYADPQRDKSHGRIWRITAEGRAPIVQPKLAEMSPDGLLKQLGSPERWTRTQAKRLLFDAPSDKVLAAADAFADTVPGERELLELIGIYEAHESPRPALLAKLLASGDPRIRAYATRVAGSWPGALPVLEEKARDANPRVRLEAVVASTYVETADAVQVVAAALDQERDPFLDYAIRLAAKALQPHWAPAFTEGDLSFANATQTGYFKKLADEEPEPPSPGAQLYETACMTCHQPEGKGLPGVYPALAGSGRVSGADPESLIKIVLHGLTGPLAAGGQTFGNQPNSVPMPPMGGLSDQQIADVLTFVRKSYGEDASGVTPEDVASVRSENRARATPWTAPEL